MHAWVNKHTNRKPKGNPFFSYITQRMLCKTGDADLIWLFSAERHLFDGHHFIGTHIMSLKNRAYRHTEHQNTHKPMHPHTWSRGSVSSQKRYSWLTYEVYSSKAAVTNFSEISEELLRIISVEELRHLRVLQGSGTHTGRHDWILRKKERKTFHVSLVKTL